ncbi:MAG: ABC transporter permease [Anaerolineales bacterium]|nr:ABC transporter permease [Anaerolineales bacterium]
MRALDVAWKDVSQLVRDWRSAAFLVGAPILFTLLMGVMMGGLGGSSEEDPRLAVGVLNRDGGAAAGGLIALLEKADAVRPVLVDEKDADTLAKQVSDGKLAAAIVIPAGYTAAVFEGNDMPLRFLVDNSSDAGSNAGRAVRGIVFRLQAAVQTAVWSADIAAAQNAFASPCERAAFMETAVQKAVQEWESAPVKLEIRSAASQKPEQSAVPSGFAQSSPGNMVTFALAGLIGAAEIIVWERKSGTLQRLLTTSISRMEILIGHFLAMFLLVFVQVLLLGTFGQLLFGLTYWDAPAAFLIMATAVTVWIAAMGLLIGAIARNAEQIAMFSIVPMLALAGLGGAWMPLEVTGAAFQAVGRLTPTYWAMHGMQNLILRAQGLTGVVLPAAVLFGFAFVFFGIAVWKFQRE